MSSVTTAVIDVGTLKAKFEVCTFDSNFTPQTLYKDKKLTVLGRDLEKNGNFIIEKSVKSTIEALKEYSKKICQHNVSVYKAVTTEAIRTAKNSEEVLNRIERETDIRLEKIGQEEEASIYFHSVSKDFPGQIIAVSDIGGGSVQVVIGKDQDIYSIHSFKTGTYFLQEKFSKSHPKHHPSKAELEQVKQYIKENLNELRNIKYKPELLVYGSSNIIDFLKVMNIKLVSRNKGSTLHPYRTCVENLIPAYEKIIKYNYEDRMPMYPEEPYYMWAADRALLNIFQIAENLAVTEVYPSNNNISSGLLYDLALNYGK